MKQTTSRNYAQAKSDRQPDWVDKLVAWGCQILHLTKYQQILTQITKFVITGVIATAIDWLIFYILAYPVQMNPLLAQVFSFLVSTAWNYYSNTMWVFNTTTGKSRQRLITEFFILSLISLGISTALLSFFIYVCHLGDMLAKVITTVFTMIFNYITRKLILEDHKK